MTTIIAFLWIAMCYRCNIGLITPLECQLSFETLLYMFIVWKLYSYVPSCMLYLKSTQKGPSSLTRAECILLFFPPTYFSFQQFFFFLTYFVQYFAHYLAIFLLIKGFFLVYLPLLSMHDCCIRVIHNMVTALLEYLNLLAVYPKA